MPLDRVGDWKRFSETVRMHIEQYAIPQYANDKDAKDQISFWSADECVLAMQRYLVRFGKNLRGRKEALRDMLKVAHYAQRTYDKLKEQWGEPDVYEERE